jgi:hypothetical protein
MPHLAARDKHIDGLLRKGRRWASEAKKTSRRFGVGKSPRPRINFVIIAWVLFIIVKVMNQSLAVPFNMGLSKRAFVLLVMN